MRGRLLALRQLAAASSVTDFVQLIDEDSCKASLARPESADSFRKLQQQGYSGLLFSALANGLQLYNSSINGWQLGIAQQGIKPNTSMPAQNTIASSRSSNSSPQEAAESISEGSSKPAVSQGSEAPCEKIQLLVLTCLRTVSACASHWGEGSRECKKLADEMFDAGIHTLMQEAWRGMAAVMHQQRLDVQQCLQQPGCTQQALANVGQRHMHAANLCGLLLQLWAGVCAERTTKRQKVSELTAAVSSTDFLAAVATGIAAIWRSEAVLQECRARTGNSSEGALLDVVTPGMEASSSHASSAGRSRSRGQRAPLPARTRAAAHAMLEDLAAMPSSMHAVYRLTWQLVSQIEKNQHKLPGSGSAHDLHWVMIMYAALQIGQVHQQQQGMSPVVLTNPPKAATSSSSSSSSAHPAAAADSSGPSSSAGASSSRSSRKSSKQAAKAQGSSQTDPLVSQQHGSVVPPYHLDLLRAAGMSASSIDYCTDLHVAAGGGYGSFVLPVLTVLLSELHESLEAAADAHTAATASSSSSSSRGSPSNNNSSSSSSSSSGSAASTLVLLDHCSLLWGAALILKPTPEALPFVTGLSQFTLWIQQTAAHRPQGHDPQQPTEPSANLLEGPLLAASRSGWGAMESTYKPLVSMLLPALLHLRAQGKAGEDDTPAQVWFDQLRKALISRIGFRAIRKAPLDSSMSDIFPCPSLSLPVLEAAVRHSWGPNTSSSSSRTIRSNSSSTSRSIDDAQAGLEVAYSIILGLTLTLTDSDDLVQHVTDSSKSPALLSLMLSCIKRLQESCERAPFRVAAIAAGAAELAVQLLGLCASSTATPSSTAGIVTDTDATHSSSGQPTNSSSGSTEQPANSSSSAGGPMAGSSSSSSRTASAGQTQLPLQFSADGTSTAASTWLVLFGRILFTAGAALQALKASKVALSEKDSACPETGLLPAPTSAYAMLRSLYNVGCQFAGLLDLYVDTLPEAAAAASAAGKKRVQVTLTKPELAQPVLQAYASLAAALVSATAYSKTLLVAEGVVAAGVGTAEIDAAVKAGVLDTAVSGRMWEQLLASEHGQVLPQALTEAGSLLCAALPTRYCCNEPSCCCLDKPSELQLAAGKGSKCSGCGVARYCGVVHQQKHWKMHKLVCRAIAAAAATAGSKGSIK